MRLTAERTKKVEIPGDPDNGFINIKALTLEEISKIESKATSTLYSDKDGATVTLDIHKRANGVALACLIGWGGMFDEKGKELKFNRANISKAASFVVVIDGERQRFLSWVDSEHSIFFEEVEGEEAAAIKN